MSKSSISLKVANLKEIKMGYERTNFYLALHTLEEDYLVTSCKNILYDGAPFEVENLEAVSKIEVWNYDTRKRIGTLHVKAEASGKPFEYSFKNHNIKILLAWADPAGRLSDSSRSASEKSDS